MYKKLLCVIISIIFVFNGVAYPASSARKASLTKSSSLQDEEFRQSLHILFSVLGFVKDKDSVDVEELQNRFGVDISQDKSGIWLEDARWRIRVYEPRKHQAPGDQKDFELCVEDAINSISIQIYFKGLSSQEKELIERFLLEEEVSPFGRRVLETILGRTKQPETMTDKTVKREVSREETGRYKKQDKQILHVQDVDGNMRPVAVYKLENPRYIEVTVDFGDGEKSYAWVDTETKEIKWVNEDDKRIARDVIERILGMELRENPQMIIDSPQEQEEVLKIEKIFKLSWKDIDRRMLRKIVIYGGLLLGIIVVSFVTGNWQLAVAGLTALIVIFFILKFIRRNKIIYEDVSLCLSSAMKKKLKKNRIINKDIREFIKSLDRGSLVTLEGEVLLSRDFNRLLFRYDEDELVDMFVRGLGVNHKAAKRIINSAKRILEYKEKVEIGDLEYMAMPVYLEVVLVRITKGLYVYRKEDGLLKRIGLGECFEYAKEGWDKLYEVLKNSREVRKLDDFIASEIADFIYDVYLSLEKGEGVEEFVQKIVQLNIADYLCAPTPRHWLIKDFKMGKVTVKAKAEVLDAVLDSMGIHKGLDFLRKIKEQTEDQDLYWALLAYLGGFEVGPKGYVPIEVIDARRNFRLWKQRAGDVTYEEVQKKLLELYTKYIFNARDNISSWGWTFLWLAYFEEGSRLYNAASDLLKDLSLRQDADIVSLVDRLTKEHNLTSSEKQKLLVSAPIDGFVVLAEMYCKDISWGKIGLIELEEELKRNMNIVIAEDVLAMDLFSFDVQDWLYTLGNIPDEVEGEMRDVLSNNIVDLVLNRLREAKLIEDIAGMKEELYRILNLLYKLRLPGKTDRFVDSIPIVDLCKLIFDYVRHTIKSDVPIRSLHFEKNKELVDRLKPSYKEIPAGVDQLLFGLTGKREAEFSKYSSEYLKEFYADLEDAQTLLIFTHTHTETVGLLHWAQEILKKNPSLKIRIIPQKSIWELNSTKQDIESILEREQKLSVRERTLGSLVEFWKKERFVLLSDCAPGLSWLKGPEKTMVKEELANASVVLGVGWENFVSFQGLKRPCYFSFAIDSLIKSKLTGCEIGEPIFVKACGGLPTTKIGVYTLKEYLTSTNWKSYRELLSYFSRDKTLLHQWIVAEAKRTGKNEVEIIRSKKYHENPVEMFLNYALREEDPEAREEAVGILLNNYERFGIKKTVNPLLIEIGDIKINPGIPLDCYYLPDESAAILKNGERKLILEVIETADGNIHLRIGDKAYRVEGIVDLSSMMKKPMLWIGNAQLAEFFGKETICRLAKEERGPPNVSIKGIPQDVLRHIPQTKPAYIHERAQEFFSDPISYLPLQLHYAVTLLSSPLNSQKVQGLNELEKLRATDDEEILEIIKEKGLTRVSEWISQEIPSATEDIFNLARFREEELRALRILRGMHLLRPPLVRMPGQGISGRFHDSVSEQVAEFGVGLVRSNYAQGTGSVLLPDGGRRYIKTGDLLLELCNELLQGEMLGAVRLMTDGKEIVQVPVNAGVLNYLKFIHQLAHIVGEEVMEKRGSEPLMEQEFTPTIEDILIIKYLERTVGCLYDGFNDFKREVAEAGSKDILKEVFVKYGLNYPADKDFALLRDEIRKLGNMLEFAGYIQKNKLGTFLSVKEFLRILIDYQREAIKRYIEQLPKFQQILLERMLDTNSEDKLNNLLIVASQLAGYHIPKVDFGSIMPGVAELLKYPRKITKISKESVLKRIDWVLQGEEPFSSKAISIVGTILYDLQISLSPKERRVIDEKVLDILSGRWLESLEGALEERLAQLERRDIAIGELREKLQEVKSYMVGQHRKRDTKAKEPKRKVELDEIHSWNEILEYVEEHKIKRVFCDIDKTIIDAAGFITTTPWFKEMTEKVGLEETIKKWRELEEGVISRGMIHLMEENIPDIINKLRSMGVEVILYTARGTEDISRTKSALASVGINVDELGLEVITSEGGGPEQKRDALVEYYKRKGWFEEKKVPSLYIDDTLGNLETVCGDKRFRHIRGVLYKAPYQKSYEVDPEEFIQAGDRALEAGEIMDALGWYYEAFYIMTRKGIAELIYDTVVSHMGIEACLEEMFSRFIKDRLDRYKLMLEREKVWEQAVSEIQPEEDKDVTWFKGAPDITSPGFGKGVKRIIVIGSHPHGDHVMGFLKYAKRMLKNLVDTIMPGKEKLKTGGPITHSLSNYWGRIGEETVVLFDLGWFPEGFITPLIQTIHPRDREILFIMDPATERTLDFERKIKKIKGVELKILPYEELLKIPVEKGRILEIENYPAYHLDPQVGSSIYMVRVRDTVTNEVVHSIGYISELGDIFPEEIDEEILEKIALLDRIIVDGTNLVAPMGEEALPLKGRPNKVHRYIKELNNGKHLIAHLNTTSIRMGEEAEIAAKNLDPDIPIIIIGGKNGIEQLMRSYQVPKDMELPHFTRGGKKIYLVHDVAKFHRKWRELGNVPKLDDILEDRIKGFRESSWTETEIEELVNEWRRQDGRKIEAGKSPSAKVREIEAFLWDLRKTKAVVISSSQFRGNPQNRMHANFKGFQILDAIVDKKDVSILIEGRLHTEGSEGTVLRVLLDKKNEDKEIQSITGTKKVRAVVDNQWRSGHITFRGLMNLLGRIADKSKELGNIYRTRSYIPLPAFSFFEIFSQENVNELMQRYVLSILKVEIPENVDRNFIYKLTADIIRRWNDAHDVSYEEFYFIKRVIKQILENPVFWERYFGIEEGDVLTGELLNRLEIAEKEMKLQGKVNNRVFVASTSKFMEVIKRVQVTVGQEKERLLWRRHLPMDPEKTEELFSVANRFSSFEVGVGAEVGKTIDLVQRRPEAYSRDIMGELKRNYLRELYAKTVAGELQPDLDLYREQKEMDAYKVDLEELLDNIKRKMNRKIKQVERESGKELSEEEKKQLFFNMWFGELKKYIESQFLRIGLRYVDKVAPYTELRKELSLLYDTVIEHVYNYLQEDMGFQSRALSEGWSHRDIAIIAGDDYAQQKPQFKDIIRLGILAGRGVSVGYCNALRNRMKGILNKLGVPVDFLDQSVFLHKRVVIASEVSKRLSHVSRDNILTARKKRFKGDVEILRTRKAFDVHTGPGGLDDIELIRMFFSTVLTEEESSILDNTEAFLRRYKEEVGYSTGGDKSKTAGVYKEIKDNLGFMGTEREFRTLFFRRVARVYGMLYRVMEKGKSKDISFGNIDEEEDIHKGVFEKADRESRLFTEDTANNISDPALKNKIREAFRFIRDIIKKDDEALRKRRYVIIVEEPGNPTMFYCQDPFASVLSHSGKRTNTIYLGLQTVIRAQKMEYRNAFYNLLLHENRDIERGYHIDLEDEAKEGIISYSDVDGIYMLWSDLITNSRYSVMLDLYLKRAKEKRYYEYFLDRIPANIRVTKGEKIYEFQHRDVLDLPDVISLNIRLFQGRFSKETQVFLLRHCADKIRYPEYKTAVNDLRYLLTVSIDEQNKILEELEECEYVMFLKGLLQRCRLPLIGRVRLPEDIKKELRDYVKLRFSCYTSADGAKVAYSVGGAPDAKRTLVFLHGLGVNSRDWRHQISLFEGQYRILNVDLRGHGRSEGLGTNPPHIKSYAQDVENILSKEGITDAILVGHSMGGMVALNMNELYADRPLEERRIKGLVLISSIVGNPTKSFFSPRLKKIGSDQILKYMLAYFSQFESIWNSSLFKWLAKRPFINLPFRKIAERWIIQKETHHLFTRKAVASVFKNEMQDLIYAFESIMTHDVEDRLASLSVPVLWIAGEGDKVVLSQDQEKDARKIRDSTFIKVPRAAHYPHARYPRRVNQEISEFINGGTYRFLQLVREKVKKRFSEDVNLTGITEDIETFRVEFLAKMKDIKEEDLKLINEVSMLVRSCGLKTRVSDELMITTAIRVTLELIRKDRIDIDLPPARPIRCPPEDVYDYLVQSV